MARWWVGRWAYLLVFVPGCVTHCDPDDGVIDEVAGGSSEGGSESSAEEAAEETATPSTNDAGADDDNDTNDDDGEDTTDSAVPGACDGLVPPAPLLEGTASYASDLSIAACESLLSVSIPAEDLVEGTDQTYEGFRYYCGCDSEWDCGYECSGPTRVVITHADADCVVGTIEPVGDDCMPSGGFVLAL